MILQNYISNKSDFEYAICKLIDILTSLVRFLRFNHCKNSILN